MSLLELSKKNNNTRTCNFLSSLEVFPNHRATIRYWAIARRDRALRPQSSRKVRARTYVCAFPPDSIKLSGSPGELYGYNEPEEK